MFLFIASFSIVRIDTLLIMSYSEGRVTIAEAAKQGHETYKREFAKDLTR